jgi:hypothetical protein
MVEVVPLAHICATEPCGRLRNSIHDHDNEGYGLNETVPGEVSCKNNLVIVTYDTTKSFGYRSIKDDRIHTLPTPY